MLRRPLVLVAIAAVVVLLLALLYVGAFPPDVAPSPVERPVPNDRFQPR